MESQIMLNLAACVLAGLVAYLLGSISFAVIVSRIYAHDDVRKYGSKNAGMTNILRTYGKLPAFFTLLGDFFKGVLAVLVGRWIFSLMGVTAFDAGYLAGFFALLGHLYPGGQPAGAADFTDYLFAGAVHHPNRFAGVDHRRDALSVYYPDCGFVSATSGAVRFFVCNAVFGDCYL